MGPFDQYRSNAYPFRFSGTLIVSTLVGGTPTDPKVAEGWLKSKLGVDNDRLIQEMVAETMVERGVSAQEAVSEVNNLKNLNGFKRDQDGLYIEGRHLKAGLKEAVNVAYAAGKLLNSKGKNSWGLTSKGIHGFAAEHIIVPEDRLYLGVTEASGINQRFVSTFRGTGIQYEEFVTDAKIDFSVHSDYEFTEENWAMIWLTGQEQGIGSSRSQGYGKYQVTRWEQEK
jgi:hypothetical protein